MKTFAQLKEELNEAKDEPDLTPHKGSHELGRAVYGNEYDEHNPLHAHVAAYMHHAFRTHYPTSDEDLGHHQRLAWAHAVKHLPKEKQIEAKPLKTKSGGTYNLPRIKNARLAFSAAKAGQNSVEHLRKHLQRHNVEDKTVSDYCDSDHLTGRRYLEAHRKLYGRK